MSQCADAYFLQGQKVTSRDGGIRELPDYAKSTIRLLLVVLIIFRCYAPVELPAGSLCG
jgi:hypothetical protein